MAGPLSMSTNEVSHPDWTLPCVVAFDSDGEVRDLDDPAVAWAEP